MQTTQGYGVRKLFGLKISWKVAVKDQSKVNIREVKFAPKQDLGVKPTEIKASYTIHMINWNWIMVLTPLTLPWMEFTTNV